MSFLPRKAGHCRACAGPLPWMYQYILILRCVMSLSTITRRLRLLGDDLRARLLHLLSQEELAVSELTRILNCSQPRVSGHLARLAEEDLVTSRREGRSVFYRLNLAGDEDPGLQEALLAEVAGTPEARRDAAALEAVIRGRSQAPPPGTLGRDYLPGRTWEGLAKALLAIAPPRRIADLGIGSGDLSLLLAEGAETMICVDRDRVALRRAEDRARRLGLENLSFRVGDLADPPIRRGEADLWVLSQVLHLIEDPGRALGAARALLAPRGQVLVLELLAHNEEWVREGLEHRRLGFTENELAALLEGAGFTDVAVRQVARDRKPPHFVTLLALGRSPS